jgi:leader peptidase (prepilin peptidase)/N-methyltransferase
MPEAAFCVLAAIVGLVIGSFLNVCIYRLPRDLSVVSPRSYCVECEKTIPWYDNVPVLSYIALRGRCRFCAEPIGIRHTVVEVLTGGLFVACVLRYGPTLEALKWAVFESILMVLFWTDMEERLLPDELTLGGLAAGLAFTAAVPVRSALGGVLLSIWGWRPNSLFNAALGAVILTVPLWFIAYLWGLAIKREAMGLGDVKLLAAMGAFLGPEGQFCACLIGAGMGAVIGVGVLIWKRYHFRSYELPFGSFLCLGAGCIALLAPR